MLCGCGNARRPVPPEHAAPGCSAMTSTSTVVVKLAALAVVEAVATLEALSECIRCHVARRALQRGTREGLPSHQEAQA